MLNKGKCTRSFKINIYILMGDNKLILHLNTQDKKE